MPLSVLFMVIGQGTSHLLRSLKEEVGSSEALLTSPGTQQPDSTALLKLPFSLISNTVSLGKHFPLLLLCVLSYSVSAM